MPRLDIDYKKTKIYKIVSKNINIKDCYVGATTDIVRRKSQHKNRCYDQKSVKYNYKVYQFIRANGGWSEWEMVVVEVFPCNTGEESHTRERYHFEALRATLNSCFPNRSREEYMIDNKERLIIYQKQYHENNKKKSKVVSKQYRIDHKQTVTCSCGSIIEKLNISRHDKTIKHQKFIKNQ